VLRELSRHASLEEIHIAEIDGWVGGRCRAAWTRGVKWALGRVVGPMGWCRGAGVRAGRA